MNNGGSGILFDQTPNVSEGGIFLSVVALLIQNKKLSPGRDEFFIVQAAVRQAAVFSLK